MRVEVSLQAIARDWRRKESVDIINEYQQQQQQQQLNTNNTANINTSDISNEGLDNISNNVLSYTSYIATAHHFDDQIETILLKFLRGVHISNIQSMDVLDNIFYKPLIDITKKQLIDYLIAKQYEWREDKSNLDNKYKRNAIRLDLIPLLSGIFYNSY